MGRNLLDRLVKQTGPAVAFAFLLSNAANSAVLYGYVQDQEAAAPSAQTAAAAQSDQLPDSLEGSWQCMTTVTDSLVSGVAPGQQIYSRVDFRRGPDGRLKADWQQSGWVEAQAHVNNQGSYVVIDRSTYYFGEGSNGNWACRSRDRYNLVEHDKVVCNSDVDQYIAGNYMGRYRTNSVLVRLRNDVALK